MKHLDPLGATLEKLNHKLVLEEYEKCSKVMNTYFINLNNIKTNISFEYCYTHSQVL